MRNRQRLSMLGAVALFLGISLSAAPTWAGATQDKEEPKTTAKKEAAPESKGSGKKKAGESCKSNSDCDQSSQSQSCRDAKCQPQPVHPVT